MISISWTALIPSLVAVALAFGSGGGEPYGFAIRIGGTIELAAAGAPRGRLYIDPTIGLRMRPMNLGAGWFGGVTLGNVALSMHPLLDRYEFRHRANIQALGPLFYGVVITPGGGRLLDPRWDWGGGASDQDQAILPSPFGPLDPLITVTFGGEKAGSK